MANRISAGSANWSSAVAAWKGTSAVAAATQLGGTTGLTGLTTGNQDSPNIVGTSETVEGILLEIGTRPGSSGTITVNFRNVTTATDNAVTLNVVDLPGNSLEGGWFFVKFPANVAMSTNTFVVRLSASASSLVNMRVVTSAGADWNRLLRLTTFVAMAAADRAWVVGEYTNAGGTGPQTAYTITMDNNNATNYGQLVVGPGGTLSFSTGATTSVRFAGDIRVDGKGTLNMGTSAGRIGGSFSAELLMVLASEGQYGLKVCSGATFRMYGATKTNFKCKLAQDAAAAATTVITDLNASGWTVGASGDLILITSTARPLVASLSQCEVKRISSLVDHATYGETLTLDTALVAAHSGLNATQAEVYNLSRNCTFKTSAAAVPLGGASVTAPTFASGTHFATWILALPASTVEIDWAYIQDIGMTPATVGKRGLEIETTTGAFTMKNASVVNARVNGLYVASTAVNNITIDDCCFYNLGNTTGPGVTIPATNGTAIFIRRNFFAHRTHTAGMVNVSLGDVGITFTDNVIIGGSTGLSVTESLYSATYALDNNEIHSCVITGVTFTGNPRGATLTGWKIWRCSDATSTSGGIFLSSSLVDSFHSVNFVGLNCVGCGQSFNANNTFALRFYNCNFHGDSLNATTTNFAFTSTSAANALEFWNCDLSGNLGAYPGRVAASTDLAIPDNNQIIQALLVGCTLGAASELGTLQASWNPDTYVRSARHDKSANTHKSWSWAGTIERDAVYYRSAVPSERLTPIVAARKLKSSPKHVAVAADQQVTVSVRVRVDTTYGSVVARLMLRRYDAAHQGGGAAQTYYAADEVMALHSGTKSAAAAPDAAGFETLSGQIAYAVAEDTVLEFFVDCEGATGFVNVDDWAVT